MPFKHPAEHHASCPLRLRGGEEEGGKRMETEKMDVPQTSRMDVLGGETIYAEKKAINVPSRVKNPC